MRLVVATGNKDKVREIRELLEGSDFEVVSMKEIDLNPHIVEDADTFEGNAMIKASAVHALCGDYVIADDSGLCIDALDGAPGIYSSRFCGENSTYDEKFNKIYELLKDVPEDKWTAHFTCAIAVVRPDGSSFTTKGICEGVLLRNKAGDNGFGYDPIFYMPEYHMTTAQMDPELKNSLSHRGKALRAAVAKLV